MSCKERQSPGRGQWMDQRNAGLSHRGPLFVSSLKPIVHNVSSTHDHSATLPWVVSKRGEKRPIWSFKLEDLSKVDWLSWFPLCSDDVYFVMLFFTEACL